MTMVADKRVLITGARTGIGKAAALLFAKEGAHVAVDVRKPGDGKEVLAEISSIGGTGYEIAMDVAEADQVEKGINEAVDKLGGLDVLVANAGIEQPQTLPASDIPLEEMNAVIDINLKGTWHCIHFAAPHLAKPGGAITLISSLWGTLGGAGLSVYTSTKGGLNAMTRALAVEMERPACA